MNKLVKGLSILAAVSLFASSVYAEKKVETKDLGPENSWQEIFDITKHQPGKYNILVEGEDKAGNKTVAGPFNMYIDPQIGSSGNRYYKPCRKYARSG